MGMERTVKGGRGGEGCSEGEEDGDGGGRAKGADGGGRGCCFG